MASQKLDDCYFYFYSSCAKGEECPYRHCQQALGTEIVCSLWREGRCFRNNCKFRHMESRINRSGIQCYWENQPGGCRKPHCVFLHRKLRNGIQPIKTNSGLILPTLDGKASPNLPDRNDQANAISMNSPAAECLSNDGDDYLPNPSSIPVPRLVLSFDEESDTESVSSTPVKVPSNDASSDLCSSAKNNLSSKFSGSTAEKDLGIKTLEQIRMEKIHKESNYYYSDETPGKSVTHRSLEISRNSTLLDETMFCYSGYEAPSLDSPRVIEHAKEYYPPQSDFISLPVSTSLDKNIPAPIKDTPHHTMDKESDLRGRLYNKRTLPSRKVNSEKQVVTTFRRQNKTTEESSNPLDFKIKTLDEIRRERESKRGNEDYSNENLTEENKAPNNNGAQKPSKKLRITRRPKDSFETSLLAAKVEPVTSLNAETGPQLVINGVQNLSDDHSQSTTVHCMDRKLLSLSQGKRKTEDVNLERQNKFLKMVPADVHDPTNKPASLNGSIHQHEEKEKQIVKSLGPFLRRPKAVTSHSTPQRSATLSELSANISSTASPILPNSIKEEDDRLSTDLIETTLKNNDTSLLNDSTCSVTSTTANQELTELDNAIDVKEEKVLERSVSVDEFDSFFNETDMNVDDIEDSSNGDDILLEVEQFLDS